jgi:hypothetical protein
MVTPPVFNYDNFIAQFPAFGEPLTEAQIQMAWDMGANWMEQNPACWGVGSYTPSKLQQAADLMGAVICQQLYGTAAQLAANGGGTNTTADEAPGALESATQGSVTANFQLPDIGSSAFMSLLLSSPPYGRLLLALLQVSASVGPYIPSCRGLPPSRTPF